MFALFKLKNYQENKKGSSLPLSECVVILLFQGVGATLWGIGGGGGGVVGL